MLANEHDVLSRGGIPFRVAGRNMPLGLHSASGDLLPRVAGLLDPGLEVPSANSFLTVLMECEVATLLLNG